MIDTSAKAEFSETLRARRGHNFLPGQAALNEIPALYATESVALDDKTVHLHYFAGGSDWYIVEVDPGSWEAFGFARVGGYEPGEWGYIDLNELEQVSVTTRAGYPLVVERDLDWSPRPLAEGR